MAADVAPGTQLSMLDVPPRRVRPPPKPRRVLPEAVERVLVALAPHLGATSIPRFHPTCVEIPAPSGDRAISKRLRAAGFRAHEQPAHDGIVLKCGPWTYWRLSFSPDKEETTPMETQTTMGDI